MRTPIFEPNLIHAMQASATLNPYWLLLRDLSAEEKLSLIELLVQSLQAAPQPALKSKPPSRRTDDNEWLYRIAGSWNDFPESAEEMIALMEGSRTLSREVEML
jgi:hypothetical protein